MDREKKKDSYLCLGLVPNFYAPAEPIDLGDFSIKRIRWGEVPHYFPDLDFTNSLEFQYIKSPFFIISGELSQAPDEKFIEGQIVSSGGKKIITIAPFDFYSLDLDEFNRPALLLNLFKNTATPAFVSLGLFRYETEKKQYITKHRATNIDYFENLISTDNDGDLFFSKNYLLNIEELSQLKTFEKNIHRFLMKESLQKNVKFIQIAMSYFLQGCLKEIDKGKEEMAILDFIIALEALYLEDEDELKYKFANRVAVLMGNSEPERKLFQEYANEIYKLRSKIVHGKLLKDDIRKKLLSTPNQGLNNRRIGDKTYSIRELLRMSIIFILSLFMNGLEKHETILKIIDAALFDVSDRERLLMMKRRLTVK